MGKAALVRVLGKHMAILDLERFANAIRHESDVVLPQRRADHAIALLPQKERASSTRSPLEMADATTTRFASGT
jgi:hypothetical protein